MHFAVIDFCNFVKLLFFLHISCAKISTHQNVCECLSAVYLLNTRQKKIVFTILLVEDITAAKLYDFILKKGAETSNISASALLEEVKSVTRSTTKPTVKRRLDFTNQKSK